MSFFTSRSGKPITGDDSSSFTPDFSQIIIPNGTRAVGIIKKISIVENPDSPYPQYRKIVEVQFKLVDGEFVGNQVSLKIKCFYGTNDSIDMGLNMLFRLLKF